MGHAHGRNSPRIIQKNIIFDVIINFCELVNNNYFHALYIIIYNICVSYANASDYNIH